MKHMKKVERLRRRQEAWEKMQERNRGNSRVNPASFKKPGSMRK